MPKAISTDRLKPRTREGVENPLTVEIRAGLEMLRDGAEVVELEIQAKKEAVSSAVSRLSEQYGLARRVSVRETKDGGLALEKRAKARAPRSK
jgi:hypothetical protein